MAMAFQAHARSISLPSRLHPGSLKVEDKLNKSKVLQDDSSSSLPSIESRLLNLADLYISLNELIQSQSTKQALQSYDQGRLVEEALDTSSAFINTCTTSRDVVSSLKDHLRDLQSSLRRKSDDVETHVASYLKSRKNSKKDITKCLGELKQAEAKSNGFAPLLDADLHVAMIIRVLREIVAVAIGVFQSLLLLLSMPLAKPKIGTKWSLISRLAGSKRLSSDVIVNEVGGVDVAVLSLQGRKSGEINFESVQRKLRGVDMGSERLEDALDTLFRSLVHNRVSLLNIVTNY